MNRGMALGGNAVSKAFGYVSSISGRKVAAAVIWLTSAYATSILIEQIRGGSMVYVSNPLTSIVEFAWGSSLIAAIIGQFVLTVCEKSIWQRRNLTAVSTVALILDVLINAAAVWPFVERFDSTSVWYFISNWLGMSGGLSNFSSGILCLVVGFILAAAPEYVWSD